MGKKAPLLADLLQEVIGEKITYGNTSGRCMAVQKLSEFCDETENTLTHIILEIIWS